MRNRGMNGFTLVECVVAMCTGTVLCAVCVAAVAAARRRDEEKMCINNLRLLHWGTVRYAHDHNDSLPPHYTGNPKGYWFRTLPPYVGRNRFYPMNNGIMCPTSPAKRVAAADWVNYAMNADVGKSDRTPPRKLSKIAKPAEAVLFSDASPKGPGSDEVWYVNHVPRKNTILPGVRGGLSEGALHHRGGLNAIFLDGHAQFLSRETLDANCTRLWEMDD